MSNENHRGNQGSGTVVVKPVPGGELPSSYTDAEIGGDRISARYHESDEPWQSATRGRSHDHCIGLSPLDAAASRLVNFLGRLSSIHYHKDPDGLRKKLVEEVKWFEKEAHNKGVDPEHIYTARYALCTALDDIVLNTEWGSQSSWNQESLTYLFYEGDKEGGTRFFRVLDKLLRERQTRASRQVLELMYVCLKFGFQGRYRHEANGVDKLKEWSEDVYRAIRPTQVMPLSAEWRGETKPNELPSRTLEWWVIGSVLLLLLIALYLFLASRLNPQSSTVVDALNSVRVEAVPMRVVEETPPPVPKEPERVTLRNLLQNEIHQNEISLDETPTRSTIVISGGTGKGKGLFRSGSSAVQKEYIDLLDRIAGVLSQLPGKIEVAGHTDNIPPSAGYLSNHALSLLRAKAVQRVLENKTGMSQRYLEPQGFGDQEPIADNSTKMGRARNRRVEITLFHYADN